ncbi:MAG: hypothetical protein Q7U02_02625 [Desulfosalsimonadaceae bacterium]|nr:hypothetical protein [Desulfosalsimonadaceae bacterium]
MKSVFKDIKHKISRIISPNAGPSAGQYPDWRRLLSDDWDEWQAAVKQAGGGPRILIATGVGGHVPVVILDSLLSVALTLRGAEVHVLLCDGALPACERLTIHDTSPGPFARHGVSKQRCANCFRHADRMYRSLGLPIHYYSEFITEEQKQQAGIISESISVDEIPRYCMDGLGVGEHAMAGALRFFARGSLTGEKFAEPVLRHYLKAALLTAYAAANCMKKYNFLAASFHHGIYIPQGVVGEVARRLDVRVANWSVAYRKKSFIFSHHDTYHHTLMSEPVSAWENMEWSDRHETEIMDYLKSRWKGTNDWIWFHERPQEDIDQIVREVGVDFSRPCIGMLTNVMWDAQLHYPANAFPDMLEWVVQTIRYFEKRPDLQLVIRIHPAELRGTVKSRQLMVDEIGKVFPELPHNVFIIPPESQISTYAMTSLCNAVIIYGTKTGVELTSMGIPVIVAGEAWIRNKGLTFDAGSPEEYHHLLERLPLPQRLSEDVVKRARKYAFHFFFRRMIPIDCIELADGFPPYNITKPGINHFMPGESKGLDVICEGILNKTAFIYPAESLQREKQHGA